MKKAILVALDYKDVDDFAMSLSKQREDLAPKVHWLIANPDLSNCLVIPTPILLGGMKMCFQNIWKL